jgi:hypothetical protein
LTATVATVEMTCERRASSDYRWARQVAALRLIGVDVVILVVDVLLDDYDVSTAVLALLLLTVAGLLAVDLPRLRTVPPRRAGRSAASGHQAAGLPETAGEAAAGSDGIGWTVIRVAAKEPPKAPIEVPSGPATEAT